MRIRTLDGKKVVEINAVDSRLKEACVAELAGDDNLAWKRFHEAAQADRLLKLKDRK